MSRAKMPRNLVLRLGGRHHQEAARTVERHRVELREEEPCGENMSHTSPGYGPRPAGRPATVNLGSTDANADRASAHMLVRLVAAARPLCDKPLREAWTTPAAEMQSAWTVERKDGGAQKEDGWTCGSSVSSHNFEWRRECQNGGHARAGANHAPQPARARQTVSQPAAQPHQPQLLPPATTACTKSLTTSSTPGGPL